MCCNTMYIPLSFSWILQVVTVVSTATVPSPTRKKQTKKESSAATTKLFPVTSVKPGRSTELLQPKLKEVFSKDSARNLWATTSSYLRQFPDLSGYPIADEYLDEVQRAALELQKEDTPWKYFPCLKELNIFLKNGPCRNCQRLKRSIHELWIMLVPCSIYIRRGG